MTECRHPFALFMLGAETMMYHLEDEELILSRHWRLVHGRTTDYAVAGQPRDHTYTRAHRLILGVTDPKVLVDHENHDGLDNRRCNLRVATPRQNAQNQRKRSDGHSSFVGVGCDRGRWRARIMVDGRSILVGYFATELEAAIARDRAALEHFGEFAHLNFPVAA